MTPIKAVLFDWGDTLFSSPRADAVIVAAAREHGLTVSPEAAAALWTRFCLPAPNGPGPRGFRPVLDVVDASQG